MLGNKIARWSFLLGVLISVAIGFITPLTENIVYIIISLGILLGLLNLSNENVAQSLTSSTAIVIVSSLGLLVVQSEHIFGRVLSSVSMVFIPITIVLALKHIFKITEKTKQLPKTPRPSERKQ